MQRVQALSFLVIGVLFPSIGLATADAKHANIVFPATGTEVTSACTASIGKAQTAFDSIAAMKADEATWSGTFAAMDKAYRTLSDEVTKFSLMGSIHSSEEVREAGKTCSESVSNFGSVQFARPEIYRVLKAVAEKYLSNWGLDSESQRMAELWIKTFEKSGAQLADTSRSRYVKIQEELAALGKQYEKNTGEAVSIEAGRGYVVVTAEQLAGMSDAFIESLKKTEDGRYYLPAFDDKFHNFMMNGKDVETRKNLEHIYENTGHFYATYDNGWLKKPLPVNNSQILKKTLELRNEAAKLLGYKNHAEYQASTRMAKTPEAVLEFLTSVRDQLAPKCEDELKTLRALKREEEQLGPEGDDKIYHHDWSYYSNLFNKKFHQVDDQKIQEYFPLNVVTKGIFDIYQSMLGLKFDEVTPANGWHPDVRLFRVRDAATKQLIGYYYMDMYSRDGKRKGAFQETLNIGIREKGVLTAVPVASLTTNFRMPTATRPSLLTHREVKTYFHEFGHVMHAILAANGHYWTSASNLFGPFFRDFVETPSQILENWVWDADMLKLLSGHHATKEPLPENLRQQLIGARFAVVGCTILRQIFYGMVDMRFHMEEKPSELDTTALWAELQADVQRIPMAEGSHRDGTFTHFYGYSAGYYSYQWALRYASDMFTRFETEGLQNPKTGMDYRKLVLEPGGLKDPLELVRSFLGREPNDDAFFRLNFGIGG